MDNNDLNEKEESIDFKAYMDSPYNEQDKKEGDAFFAAYFKNLHKYMELFQKEGLNDLCTIEREGSSFMEPVIFLVDALSRQADSRRYLQDAVDLSEYIRKNFTFDKTFIDERTYLSEMLMAEAHALNELGRYKECDALLDEIEAYTPKGKVLAVRLEMMMYRDDGGLEKAGRIAAEALEDKEFLETDKYVDKFLRAAMYVFDELDDEHLDEVAELISERRTSDPESRKWMDSVLEQVSTMLESGEHPEMREEYRRLRSIGCKKNEILQYLAYELLQKRSEERKQEILAEYERDRKNDYEE